MGLVRNADVKIKLGELGSGELVLKGTYSTTLQNVVSDHPAVTLGVSGQGDTTIISAAGGIPGASITVSYYTAENDKDDVTAATNVDLASGGDPAYEAMNEPGDKDAIEAGKAAQPKKGK